MKKLKLAFILGDYLVGPRPMSFNDLWTGPRGMTGSEIGITENARILALKGHDISLFTVHTPNKPAIWENVKLYELHEMASKITPDFDAVISWCDPNPLKDISPNLLRLVSHQLNGFSYCDPNFKNFFDIWISPSQSHKEHHQKLPGAPTDKEWVVIPDGCNPEHFVEGKKVPGRMIWASSAERGLHLLLSVWPEIKKRAPEANLKIFYNFNYGTLEQYEKHLHINVSPDIFEFAQRIRYIQDTIPKLKHLGVEHIGSVSRERIAQEYSEATVMAYPCDPNIDYVEGFSCSLLEACAFQCCPVASEADALGSIYKDVVPMVKRPVRHNLKQFTDLVVRALTDETYRNEINAKCKEFATKLTWENGALELERVILEKLKSNTITYSTPVKQEDKTPQISIIVPTSRHGGLDILFEGLKHQTIKDFELILVDALYNQRKDLVAEKTKLYDFAVKHIEPTKNIFPITNRSNILNTGLVNAVSKIVVLFNDYTYLEPKCIEKHINFHLASPAVNIGYIGDEEYKEGPTIQKNIIKYGKDDADLYANDLKLGKLNNYLWSVYEEELKSIDKLKTSEIDTEKKLPFQEVNSDYISRQNVSFKLEAALKINGFNEAMDGTSSFQDMFFAEMLKEKLDFTWMIDSDNKVFKLSPNIHSLPKQLRSININDEMVQEAIKNNFNEKINNYSLRTVRNSILGNSIATPIKVERIEIKKGKKPRISIVIPTNRVGGLDLLFEGLKRQSFQDFELVLVDALYNARKKVVAEKSKLYNFSVKHIEPIDNDFPVSNYCRSINTGLINANGELVYLTCDYAYLEKDTLLKHNQFHMNTPRNYMLMMPVNICEFDHNHISKKFPMVRQYGTRGEDAKYQLQAVPESDYVSAHNKWSDDYAADIKDGKLDEVMWSIFDQEVGSNGMTIGDIIASTARDTKFDNLSVEVPKEAFGDFVCLKNDSFKLDFIMDANGLDEIMDKNHGYQDTLFSRGLKDLYNGKFFAINTSPVAVINSRYYLEPRKVQGYKNNDIIMQRYGRSEKITNNVITKWKEGKVK